MQELYAWSGLWRPISLRYFYHRLILICIAAAFLTAAGLYLANHQQNFLAAAVFGAETGIAIFLSWAIARELHPDASQAAFVAVALASLGLWFWPDPNVLMLLLILLLCRLLNRTSGVPARAADMLLLLGLTSWLLYRGEIMAGVLATVVFWINSRLPRPQTWHKYIALLPLALLVLLLTYKPHLINFNQLSIHTNILIITLASGFALFSRKVKEVKSTADANGEPLHLARVRAAQVVILLVLSVFCLWYGDTLFSSLVPVWAGLGGIFLYAAIRHTA